jgi:hypothetical protein
MAGSPTLHERMRLLRGLTETDLQRVQDERITLVRSPGHIPHTEGDQN